jgi:hypothetical protein
MNAVNPVQVVESFVPALGMAALFKDPLCKVLSAFICVYLRITP